MSEMDTRVGCGAVSILADITEEAIRNDRDEYGRPNCNPDWIAKYLALRKYLDNYDQGERK